MSMRPEPIGPVPADTARVARVAFPKGTTYVQMRDVLGAIYEDEDFAELFEARGSPAIAPWRLALVTVMQFDDGFSDRQAAKAVRSPSIGNTPWVSSSLMRASTTIDLWSEVCAHD